LGKFVAILSLRRALILEDQTGRGPQGHKRIRNGEGGMVAKKAGKSRKGGEQLNPLVKSWLDDVIIPALVEEYIEMQKKNRLGATSDSEKLLLSVIWSRNKGQSSQGLISRSRGKSERQEQSHESDLVVSDVQARRNKDSSRYQRNYLIV
jgi:hypothetical protein